MRSQFITVLLNWFSFGSEMWYRNFTLFEGKINEDAVYHLLKFSYVPSPISIYEDIYKLPAGSI